MPSKNRFKLKRLNAAMLMLLAPGFGQAAPVDWTGESGYWDVAGHWSTSALPRRIDDVRIDVPGRHTVTVRSEGGPVTINSVNMHGGDETLTIWHDGSLTLQGSPTAHNPSGASVITNFRQFSFFDQSAGTVNGPGDLTVTGHADIGHIPPPPPTTWWWRWPVELVDVDQLGNISPPPDRWWPPYPYRWLEHLTPTAPTHAGPGVTTFKGTTNTVTGGGLALDAGRVLRNEGHLTSGGGRDYRWGLMGWGVEIRSRFDLNATDQGGSGRIDNAAGALWEAQGDLHIFASGHADRDAIAGQPAFNNAGAFRKSGGTGTVSVAFNNTGRVEVERGVLSLEGGGVHSGALQIAPGAELVFFGGTHDLNAGTTLAVSGTLAVGTMSDEWGYWYMRPVVVNSHIAADIAGTTRVGSGSLNLHQSWQTANFNQWGGTVNGPGDLTVTGHADISVDWFTPTTSTHAGPGATTFRGTTTVSGGSLALDAGRVLRNEGHLTSSSRWDRWGWDESNFDLNASGIGGSGRIDNAAGALWEARADTRIFASDHADLDAGQPAFNNAGTFRNSREWDWREWRPATTTVSVAFNNTGTVDVQAGRFRLDGSAMQDGFINHGTIAVASGSVFQTSSTDQAFINQGRLEGSGSFHLEGSGNSLVNNGVIAAGSEAGTGTLTVDLGDDGLFRQTAGGILDFSLASLTQFDALAITGSHSRVELDGTLRISSWGGFNPSLDDWFTIMTFNTGGSFGNIVSGVFDHIVAVGFDFDPSLRFQAKYLADSVRIQVVPLPAAAWFMLSALGFLAARRLREESVS